MNIAIWLGIIFCITQSAMFSGLNLAFFSVSKLRLQIESSQGNKHAIKVSRMREDSNFLLTTILWGNVGINVLLTLLSNSVMAGVVAFLFSTFIITFLGEIFPQAYFSRHALRMGYYLSPVLRFYQFILYPNQLIDLPPDCIPHLHFFRRIPATNSFTLQVFTDFFDKIAVISGKTDKAAVACKSLFVQI